MMRVDLEAALESGDSISFEIDWEHNIVNQSILGGRGGYEHFEEKRYLPVCCITMVPPYSCLYRL